MNIFESFECVFLAFKIISVQNYIRSIRFVIFEFILHYIDGVKVFFVGLTIDNKLTWLPHLKLLARKLSCSGQLNRIKIVAHTLIQILVPHLI